MRVDSNFQENMADVAETTLQDFDMADIAPSEGGGQTPINNTALTAPETGPVSSQGATTLYPVSEEDNSLYQSMQDDPTFDMLLRTGTTDDNADWASIRAGIKRPEDLPEESPIRAALFRAKDIKGSAVLEAQRNAERLGLPMRVALASPETAHREAMARDIEKNLLFASWAAQSPENAALARDNMAALDNMFKALGTFSTVAPGDDDYSPMPMPFWNKQEGPNADRSEFADFLLKTPPVALAGGVMDFWSSIASLARMGSEEFFGEDNQFAKYMESIAKTSSELIPRPEFQSFLGGLGYDVSRAVPPMVAAILTTALTKSPYAGAMMMGAHIAGSDYQKFREWTGSNRAGKAAVLDALLQTPLEAIGLGKISKLFATKGFANILKQGGITALTEGTTEFLQHFPEWLSELYAKAEKEGGGEAWDQIQWITGKLTSEDEWRRFLKDAAYEGLVGMTLGGLIGGVQIVRGKRQLDRANAFADAHEKFHEYAMSDPQFADVPPNLLAEALRDSNPEMNQTVNIAAEELFQLAENDKTLLANLGLTEEKLKQDAANGRIYEISIADIHARLIDPVQYKAVMAVVRETPGAYSAQEGRDQKFVQEIMDTTAGEIRQGFQKSVEMFQSRAQQEEAIQNERLKLQQELTQSILNVPTERAQAKAYGGVEKMVNDVLDMAERQARILAQRSGGLVNTAEEMRRMAYEGYNRARHIGDNFSVDRNFVSPRTGQTVAQELESEFEESRVRREFEAANQSDFFDIMTVTPPLSDFPTASEVFGGNAWNDTNLPERVTGAAEAGGEKAADKPVEAPKAKEWGKRGEKRKKPSKGRLGAKKPVAWHNARGRQGTFKGEPITIFPDGTVLRLPNGKASFPFQFNPDMQLEGQSEEDARALQTYLWLEQCVALEGADAINEMDGTVATLERLLRDGPSLAGIAYQPEQARAKADNRTEGKTAEGHIAGREGVVYYQGGEDSVRYELWEMDDVITSHDPLSGFIPTPGYPPEAQPREYKADEQEKNKVRQHASGLRPEMIITDNPDLVNGPPTVTQDGITLGGNSRAMSLKIVFDKGKHLDKYLETLRNKAPIFGLRADDVAKFRQPVLVRVIQQQITKEEMARKAVLYNKTPTQEMDRVVEGGARGQLMSGNSLAILANGLAEGEYTSLREYLRDSDAKPFVESLIRDKVIDETELAKALESDGALTVAGVDIVENALCGYVVSDTGAVRALRGRSRRDYNRLLRVLPYLAIAKKQGGNWDISEQVIGAIRLLSKNGSLDENLNTGSLVETGRPPSRSVVTMARAIRESPSEAKLAAHFATFAKLSTQKVNPLMGVNSSLTAGSAFEEAFLKPVAIVDGQPVLHFNPDSAKGSAYQFAVQNGGKGHKASIAMQAIDEKLEDKNLPDDQREIYKEWQGVLAKVKGRVDVYEPVKLNSDENAREMFQSVDFEEQEARIIAESMQIEDAYHRVKNNPSLGTEYDVVATIDPRDIEDAFVVHRGSDLNDKGELTVRSGRLYGNDGSRAHGLVKIIYGHGEKFNKEKDKGMPDVTLADLLLIPRFVREYAPSEITQTRKIWRIGREDGLEYVLVVGDGAQYGVDRLVTYYIGRQLKGKGRHPVSQKRNALASESSGRLQNLTRDTMPGDSPFVPDSQKAERSSETNIGFQEGFVNPRPMEILRQAAEREGKAEELEKIMRQRYGNQNELFQQAGQIYGSTQIMSDGSYVVSLFQGANLSSILHETAHVWFEEMERVTKMEGCPEELKADFAKLRGWVGAEEDVPLNVDQKEQLARGMEAYFREGKAPAEELTGIFSRFKKWLMRIYQVALQLNVQLTDEVREVFDRMFATEEEIREAHRQNEIATRTEEIADALKLTGADRKAYLGAAQGVADAAEHNIERVRNSNARTRRRQYEAEARAAVDNDRLYPLVDALKDAPLDLDDIKANFGQDMVNRLRARNSGWVKKGSDVVAEELASEHGYDSAEEMVNDLAERGKSRRKAISDYVREKVAEYDAQHKVEDYLEDNEKIISQLEMEGQYVAKQLGQENVSRSDIRSAAVQALLGERMFYAMRPEKYRMAYRRAAKAERRAIVKGDFNAALTYNYQARLNFELAAMSRDLRNNIRSVQKTARKFVDNRKYDPRARFAVMALGSQHGLMRWNERLADGKDAASFEEWQREAEDEGYFVGVMFDEAWEGESEPRFENRVEWLPVQDYALLSHQLNNIITIERNKHKELRQAARVDLDELAQSLADTIHANRETVRVKTVESDPFLKRRLKDMHASHSKIEVVCEALDGKPLGPLWQAIYAPINEAEDNQTRRLRKMQKDMERLFSVYSQTELAKYMASKEYEEAIGESLTMQQRLMVALNMGNEGNLERLRNGHGWTDEQIAAVVKPLTERDWRFVESVWDYLDTFRDEAFQLEEDVNGLKPERVEAQPFTVTTADGKTFNVKGGYFPIRYSAEKDMTPIMDEASLDEIMTHGLGYASIQTKQGALKQRTKYGKDAPLMLSFNVIADHAFNMIHDICYRKAILDVAKIVRHQTFRDAFTTTDASHLYRLFMPWLADCANEKITRQFWFDPLAKWGRSATTMMMMGLKFTTMFTQPVGITQSAHVLGGWKYLFRSMRDMFTINPSRIADYYQEACQRSAFMEARLMNYDRDIRDMLKQINAGVGVQKLINKARSFAFKPMGGFQMFCVDLPTWWAGYEKGLKDYGGDEKKAVAYADHVVRMSQGSGSTKDLAAIQRGGELSRLLTMFYSYFNTLYNVAALHVDWAKKHHTPADIWLTFCAAMNLWFIPAIVSELVAGRGPDDDDDEWWWALKQEMNYPLQTIVVLREMGNALWGEYDYQFTPAEMAPKSIVNWVKAVKKKVEGKGQTETVVKKSAEMTGYLLGLPLKQPIINADNFYHWLIDESDFRVRDLFFPPRKNERQRGR